MADGDDRPVVLVTGASGFVAGHVVRQLLATGRYRVRGTVRDVEKYAGGRDGVVPAAVELRQCDLTSAEGWADAVEGCRYVLHVASPVLLEVPKDEAEIVGPAVAGVEHAVGAAVAAGVRRVVLTSSTASVSGGQQASENPNRTYTEADFTLEEHASAYDKSKVRAERRARELVQGTGTELAVMCPALILGEALNRKDFPSREIMHRLMNDKMPLMPDIRYGLVDVRDVALAHIRGMEREGAAGGRFILAAETVTIAQMSAVLREEFGPLGYTPPTRVAWDWVMRAAGLFDPALKTYAVPLLGWEYDYDHSRAEEVLGLEWTPRRDTLVRMANSMIDLGLITPDRRPKPDAGAAAAE